MYILVVLNTSGTVVYLFAFTTNANAQAALAAFLRSAGTNRHPKGYTASVIQAPVSDTTFTHSWI